MFRLHVPRPSFVESVSIIDCDLHYPAFVSRRTNLSPFTKGCREKNASMEMYQFFQGASGTQQESPAVAEECFDDLAQHVPRLLNCHSTSLNGYMEGILAEGAMSHLMTFCGRAMFAS